MLQDVRDDSAHRQLASNLLQAVCAANDIGVESVDFGERDLKGQYAWLCYVADPREQSRRAALTESSAHDHIKRFDPNGFLRSAGSCLRITIIELETSNEASFLTAGPDGADVLFSPWQHNLVFVRATFNHAVVG